jgi:Tfp pilus assembly ATPase PilU
VQEGEREGKSLTDAMDDGVLEGMQTFDYVLEQLINKGALDKDLGLSYATNRTNLALRLETQGSDVNEAGPALAGKPAGAAGPGAPAARPAPPRSELDDLIER